MDKKSREKYIVGIDEVGRGPLAGPITLCALKILSIDMKKLQAVKPVDSKKLSAKNRLKIYRDLYKLRKEKIIDFKTSSVSNIYIDKYGIRRATQKGINNVLNSLKLSPKMVCIKLDGLLHAPSRFKKQRTIIKGDEKEIIIGAASIIAKVKRDRLMKRLANNYYGYGFKDNVGYGSSFHIQAIKKLGLSKIHRRSFCKDIAKIDK